MATHSARRKPLLKHCADRRPDYGTPIHPGGSEIMKAHHVVATSILLSTAAAGALAQSAQMGADAAAEAFAARESVQHISLSPDGAKVAIVAPVKGRGSALVIADLTKGGVSEPILTSTGDPEQLGYCKWSTNVRLICGVTTMVRDRGIVGFSRLLAINSDGGGMKMLSTPQNSRSLGFFQGGGNVIDWMPEGAEGSVLMTANIAAEEQTGTILGRSREGMGVELVDTTTLKRKLVEQPNAAVVEYITDGLGAVRIVGLQSKLNSGDIGDTITYRYRLKDSREWQPLGTLDIAANTGFSPYAVDRDLNVVYGFQKQDGRSALYRISLDGAMKRELVLARPDVDVDGLIRFGRKNRVVGASYATEHRHAEFFDPALQKLRSALGKALPTQPIVTFVDASADENKLLLFAGSDTDPGRYYLYDKTTRQLAEVLPQRPQLTGAVLATVKPVTFAAADGTQIPGYLTLPAGSNGKNLPGIVMPHGGPGARDEWGFDWLAQFFAARGYAVLQPNYRGSTGYGDAWFRENGWKSWKTAIGDVNDGGRWLVNQGIVSPDKLAIVGWSYGGYAALQSPVLDPDLFKAIVAIAPVTDLDVWREEWRNFTNYTIMDKFIGRGPHIQEGSPARNAARIKAPVLMFHGDRDANVGVGESRLMASRLKEAGKRVDYVEFDGLDHQLDDDVIRTQMLGRTDAFLRTSMGIK